MYASDLVKRYSNNSYEIDMKTRVCQKIGKSGDDNFVKIIILNNPKRYYLVIGDWAFKLYFFDYDHKMPDGIDLDGREAFIHIAYFSLDERGYLKFAFSVKDWRNSHIVLCNMRNTSKGSKFGMITLDTVTKGKYLLLLLLANSSRCRLSSSGVLRMEKFKCIPLKIQGVGVDSLLKEMIFG